MADEDMERRVSRLEEQLDDRTGLPADIRLAREDARAARHLAAGSDRDVADLHTEVRDFRYATTHSFNAMREDLRDLKVDVDGLRGEVDGLRGEMNARFEIVEGALCLQGEGQRQIVGMLNMLIERDDRSSE